MPFQRPRDKIGNVSTVISQQKIKHVFVYMGCFGGKRRRHLVPRSPTVSTVQARGRSGYEIRVEVHLSNIRLFPLLSPFSQSFDRAKFIEAMSDYYKVAAMRRQVHVLIIFCYYDHTNQIIDPSSIERHKNGLLVVAK